MGSQNRLPILRGVTQRTGNLVALKWVLVFLTILISSCGGNLFESMSNKDSHDAVIQDVQKLVNELRFSDAVELIEANSDLTVTDRRELMLFASAYAGSCGLTFAEVFDSLETAGGSPMFFIMNAFRNRIVNPARCFTAQQWLQRIGTVANRTSTENIAMFLIGFAKVGTYLRNRADTSASGVGDGVVDPTFDSCDNADLPRDEVKQIITGFGLMIENIAALGSNLSAGMTADINNLNAACTLLGLNCTTTNPAAVTDADADEFRDAIKSDSATQIGIENCDPASPLCCP